MVRVRVVLADVFVDADARTAMLWCAALPIHPPRQSVFTRDDTHQHGRMDVWLGIRPFSLPSPAPCRTGGISVFLPCSLRKPLSPPHPSWSIVPCFHFHSSPSLHPFVSFFSGARNISNRTRPIYAFVIFAFSTYIADAPPLPLTPTPAAAAPAAEDDVQTPNSLASPPSPASASAAVLSSG